MTVRQEAGRHLLQVLALEQMVQVYEDLQKQATAKLPIAKDISDLGDLIAVDGALIDTTLSML